MHSTELKSRVRSIRSALQILLLTVASLDRKSTRLNSSHDQISYAVFCLTKQTGRAARPPRSRNSPPGTSPPQDRPARPCTAAEEEPPCRSSPPLRVRRPRHRPADPSHPA